MLPLQLHPAHVPRNSRLPAYADTSRATVPLAQNRSSWVVTVSGIPYAFDQRLGARSALRHARRQSVKDFYSFDNVSADVSLARARLSDQVACQLNTVQV